MSLKRLKWKEPQKAIPKEPSQACSQKPLKADGLPFFHSSTLSLSRTSRVLWSRVKHGQHDWTNILYTQHFDSSFTHPKLPPCVVAGHPPAHPVTIGISPPGPPWTSNIGIEVVTWDPAKLIDQKKHQESSQEKKTLDYQAYPPSQRTSRWTPCRHLYQA